MKREDPFVCYSQPVHKQIVERCFNSVLGYYYRLFYFMEEEEILDSLNEINLLALHYIYEPKINEKLKLLTNAWAAHKLRTVKTNPRLWTDGNFNNPVEEGVSESVDNFLEHGLNELEENPRSILERGCPAT